MPRQTGSIVLDDIEPEAGLEQGIKSGIESLQDVKLEPAHVGTTERPKSRAVPQPYLFTRPAHILTVWSLLLVSALGVVVYMMLHEELLARVLDLVAL